MKGKKQKTTEWAKWRNWNIVEKKVVLNTNIFFS